MSNAALCQPSPNPPDIATLSEVSTIASGSGPPHNATASPTGPSPTHYSRSPQDARQSSGTPITIPGNPTSNRDSTPINVLNSQLSPWPKGESRPNGGRSHPSWNRTCIEQPAPTSPHISGLGPPEMRPPRDYSPALSSKDTGDNRAPQGIRARHTRPRADPPGNWALPNMEPLTPSLRPSGDIDRKICTPV